MASAWSIVARTEYSEGVRSRSFRVMTLLGPILMVGLIAISAGLQIQAIRKPRHLALLDRSVPSMGAVVKSALEVPVDGTSRFFVESVPDPSSGGDGLDLRVTTGELDGYLVLPEDAARGGRTVYRGTNASSTEEMGRLRRTLRAAVMGGRAGAMGLDGSQVAALLADVDVDAEQASGGGGRASGGAAFAVAYAASFLLYMAILLYGVSVMRSVIQEKSNRVVELLVACARPSDLMIGKVVGVGGVGLTQMGVWVGAGLLLSRFRGPLLAAIGIEGAGSVALPPIGAGEIAIILVYFLGGYALYAAMYAAVGAANNSEREAQQAQIPFLIPMVAAFMCFPAITSAPNSPLAVVLTLVPLSSPVLMPMRYMLAPVPWWQLAASLGLLLVTAIGTVGVAARIYRTGILMYGKKASFGEVVKWLRAS